MNEQPKFIQIAGGKAGLYALDQDGRVWRYCPAKGSRYAFWSRLTGHRAGTVEKVSDDPTICDGA